MVMETYHRKRNKKSSLTKMQSSPVIGRHQSVPTSSDKRKAGSVYEIDHVHLPVTAPSHLRSIRVAMISTESMNKVVVVRYPSVESLRAFFSYSKRETHPALDEKFDMETEMAGNVLVRLVPVKVFNEQKSMEGFWVISSGDGGLEQDKKGGFLFDKLKINGGMRWGIRRQVKYLGKHMGGKFGSFINVQNVSTSLVSGEENGEGKEDDEEDEVKEHDEGKEKENKENDEEEKEDEENGDDEVEEEDESEEEVEVKIEEADGTLKRKRCPLRNMSKKKPKKEEESQKLIKKKKKGPVKKNQSMVLKHPKDRWSSERYKQAENSLVEVMKVQKATAEKPVLRPQLRVEARKRIGDTGLLDHLLKHMAGKLAPGGDQRFRRRHNADGAMQYWLESADLVNIRKEAGITDPYWIPPPGWKHGDPPNQDPNCARELKLLKDKIENMKRRMDLVATHKELEEEVEKLRREVEELSKKRQDESQITILTPSSDSSQKLEHLATSLVSSKSGLDNDPVTLAKYKEQLLVISDFVKEIEGNVRKIIFEMDEKSAKLNSSLIVARDSFTATDDEQLKALANTQQEVVPIIAPGQDLPKLTKTQTAEQKAAKIQRLKSGFRICKPQGTFLWPDMVKNNINVNPGTNNTVMVQLMDHVPTPPSVSSSAPPQLAWPHQEMSPVKPKPEIRTISITASSAPMINLNDSPVDPTPMPLLSTITKTGQLEGTTGFGPRNVMGYNEPMQNKACSSSSASSFPWWSLSTSKYASDESRHG